MTPSPFQIGQAIGSNIGQVQERHTDLTAIDQILSQAGQSGDQQAIDTAMNQILARVSPNRQKTALDILQKRRDAISTQQKSMEDRGVEEQEVQALMRAGISEEIARAPKGARGELIKADKKEKEAAESIQGAKSILNRMKELGKTGHLGPKISQYGGLGFASGNVRRDRAEYERLGKALIPFATSIPIRNRIEFETLAGDLSDPTLTDATREGILKAMERIIAGGKEGESREKRPLTDFFG